MPRPNFSCPPDMPGTARKRFTYAILGCFIGLAGAPACAEKPPAGPIDVTPDEAYRTQQTQDETTASPNASPAWSQTAVATGVTIQNAPASVRVIPELRGSYSIEAYVAGGNERFLLPRFEVSDDRLIFDGGFSEQEQLCQQPDGTPEAPIYLIIVRTPPDLRLQLKDALMVDIETAQALRLNASDCVQVNSDVIAGHADLTLRDNSAISVSSIEGGLRVDAADEASIITGRVGGDLETRLTGSATMDAGPIGGELIQTVKESGSLSLRGD